ncbi:MAG: hypothetical protein ACI81Q_000135 [Paracoccaceae bacterium]|jgi:hypothetical protein
MLPQDVAELCSCGQVRDAAVPQTKDLIENMCRNPLDQGMVRRGYLQVTNPKIVRFLCGATIKQNRRARCLKALKPFLHWVSYSLPLHAAERPSRKKLLSLSRHQSFKSRSTTSLTKTNSGWAHRPAPRLISLALKMGAAA